MLLQNSLKIRDQGSRNRGLGIKDREPKNILRIPFLQYFCSINPIVTNIEKTTIENNQISSVKK